jgi:hypothetical protein
MFDRINAWKGRAPDELQEEIEGQDEEALPDRIKLPLPSRFLPDNGIVLLQGIERQLREALAFENLKALRKCLAEELALEREKERFARGQADNFRSQAALRRVRAEIKFVASRYRTTYDALRSLGGVLNTELKDLNDNDISATNVFNYSRELGRGANIHVSWIWRQSAIGTQARDDNWLEEGVFIVCHFILASHSLLVLRIQFLEAKVNRDRWAEECEMTKEELKLTRRTFEHLRDEWDGRAARVITEGEAAHSRYMAAMYERMAMEVLHHINVVA